ncbi:protein Iojap-related, mitochondrial-like [Rosa chinensis]|uniref:protein Iojap-related, mitochondrial-like n=1 Tax=Rosa chinensis TaxID=74649 RepID=UPI001AD90F48|nr:protein Iojap-related, mitochondrial-like [Rosa chinensis]
MALHSQIWPLGFGSSCEGFPSLHQAFSSSSAAAAKEGLLDLQEVKTVLSEVKTDDVKVIPTNKHCKWADFMVLAIGRSTWHVKNIAQALIYKAGKVIVHALDENAKAYYNLETL